MALFVALGGTPYAATQLPRNSVGPKQIEASAVRSADVKNETLKGADVNEATLGRIPNAQRADIAVSASTAANADLLDNLDSTDFLRSNVEAGGDLSGSFSNLQIAGGTVGSSELLELIPRENTATVTGGTVGNNIWNHNSATASCNSGEQLIAGNAAWANEAAGDPMAIVEIDPDFSADSVTVRGATDVSTDRTLRAIAICLG